MTDLLEQLRYFNSECAARLAEAYGGRIDKWQTLLGEAADEIERLRKELERLRNIIRDAESRI